MGLRRTAQPLAVAQPELARQLIRAATCAAAPDGESFEYVYLFRGLDYRDDTPVYKLGRSHRIERRLKEVRNQAIFADWGVVHHIHCFAERSIVKMRPSEGDTLESLFHGLFASYRTAQAYGTEYFTLPQVEVDFISSIHYINALSLNIGVLNGTPNGMHERWR
jgi:hypothetical protein